MQRLNKKISTLPMSSWPNIKADKRHISATSILLLVDVCDISEWYMYRVSQKK